MTELTLADLDRLQQRRTFNGFIGHEPKVLATITRAELLALIALARETLTGKAVEAFYAAVNARAEADMLNGKPVTGAHHRALEAEIAKHRETLQRQPQQAPETGTGVEYGKTGGEPSRPISTGQQR